MFFKFHVPPKKVLSLYLNVISTLVTIFFWAIAIIFFIRSIPEQPDQGVLDALGNLFERTLRPSSEPEAGQMVATLSDAIVALLIGLLGDKVASVLSMWARELALQHSQDEISEAVYKSSNVQAVGAGDKVIASLRESLWHATHVRNTFLNVGGAHEVDSDEENKILDVYEEFLRADPSAVWQDIISVNELYKFRHTKLFTKNAKPTGKDLATHKIGVLKRSMPIINFILLENPDANYYEVYFGWIYDSNRTSTMIYKSRDPAMFALFKSYFNVLWDEKRVQDWKVPYECPPDQRGPEGKFAVMKEGWWITVAIEPPQKPHLPAALTYALLHIRFDQRNPLIDGTIITSDFKQRRHISHERITPSVDKLFVEYEDHVGTEAHRGYCIYNFFRRGEQEIIRGDLVQTSGPRSPESTARIILGLRVTEEEEQKCLPAKWPDIEQILVSGYLDKLRDLVREEMYLSKDAKIAPTKEETEASNKSAPEQDVNS